MSSLPSGTVTFLFTDIEGSTQRWEAYPLAMQEAFAGHEAFMRHAIEANGGYAYKMIGDAFQAAFPSARQALQAALDAQVALFAHTWPSQTGEVKVRMALHTGVTEERGDDYVGPVLNRVARLMSSGHGGQVLISQATQQLLRDALPPSVTLRDIGEHRLKDLTQPERIFQMVTESLPSEFPPLKTLDNRPNNLPVQSTPLVGREKEVEAVRSRLLRSDVRLLTLTGVGGIGKTRVALQVGADLLDDFPDGVFFVNLAPLIDPGLVIPTTANTLGLREAGGRSIAETLKEFVKDKRLLLVLDNFEQVPEAAPSVADLLKSASQVKVLVTSRAALGLSMEHQHIIPPLGVPDPKKLPPLEALSQYEAVALFIQRAKAVKSDFEVNNANAPAVAEICYRLEGIPLALELAAARIKALPPQAILSRLSSRLKLLTGGAKDLPSRHQTLRGTIEWSYDLLSEGDKQLFRRLSVFRRGRTLEAVEEVCNSDGDLEIDVLDGVTSLVDKSLMYTVEGMGGEPRYLMLETVHEYAREKLEESREVEELQNEHALYFMRLAEAAEVELRGANQEEWLARLEDEQDNIRSALQWASGAAGTWTRAEAMEIGLRLGGAIWRFWHVRGYFSEGWQQLLRFLERQPAQALQASQAEQGGQTSQPPAQPGDTLSSTARARALNGAGSLAYLQGDHTSARTLFEESLALFKELGDKWGIATALNSMGNMAYLQGDYDAARSQQQESLALFKELGDKWGIATALNSMGNMAYLQGDYDAARSLQGESLDLRRELRDKRGIAVSLNNLGNVAYLQGDHDAARSLYDEGLALRRELGDKAGTAAALSNLGNVAQARGDYASARSLYDESLALYRELGDKAGIAAALNSMGNMAQVRGDYDIARSLYEEGLALRRQLGDQRGIAVSLNSIGSVVQEQGDYDAARSLQGESLALFKELGDKWGIATALNSMGNAVYLQGNHKAARSLREEGLALQRELGDKEGMATSLNNLGSEAQARGDYTYACALYDESLALYRELGDKRGIAATLAGRGGVAVDSAGSLDQVGTGRSRIPRETERGARLLGTVEALLESIGAVLAVEDRVPYERAVAFARATLGEERFERLRVEGRAMSMELAIKYALERTP